MSIFRGFVAQQLWEGAVLGLLRVLAVQELTGGRRLEGCLDSFSF